MSQSGFEKVFYDVSQLCDLQWQLLIADSLEAKRSAVTAVACLAIAAVFASVTAIVLALTLTWSLHESAQLSLTTSFGITAAVMALLTVIVAWTGIRSARSTTAYFEDSKTEFNENIRWLRATILDPDSPRNQMALRQSESVGRAPSGNFRY